MSHQEQDLSNEVWQVLGASPWFHLIDASGIIQKRLESQDDSVVDQMVRYLSLISREEPSRITEIAQGWMGKSGKWDERLLYLVSWANLEDSRPLFDLCLYLLNTGALDQMGTPFGSSNSLTSLYELPKKQPEWACELLGVYFERRLRLTLAQGQTNPFNDYIDTMSDQSTNGALLECASGAPRKFVVTLLPFMLRLMELNTVGNGTSPLPDHIWPYHFYGVNYGLKEEIMSAMETALRTLAEQAPVEFIPYTMLLRNSDCETAQFLLIRAYEANGERFADDAIDYLCEKSSRLHTGYADNGYWATRQLLDAVTPHCSEERLSAIEKIVMDYYNWYERSSQGYRKGHGTEFGRAQLTLLNGIAESRRSKRTARRLEEWRRKFGIQDNEPARGIISGSVGSPISATATDMMTDQQWLKAIARYNNQDERYNEHGFTGGAHQLSGVLEGKVTQEPERFAKLALRFPDDTQPDYFDAVLRGLGKVNEDVNVVLEVCRRCHKLPSRPSGRWICQPISKVAEKPLPNELLDLVGWYATEAYDDTKDHGRDLEFAGLNSTRGSAALMMADLIYADKGRADFFLPFLERMVQDPSLAVRSCVAEALTATLNYDRQLSVDLFLRLFCDVDDVLLGGHHVERFIYHASYSHYNALLPLLERGLASANPTVVNTSARLACINALLSKEALSLAQQCVDGSVPQRRAAAQVFATNLPTASNRKICETSLIRLFNDQDETVSEEAASCFRHFKDAQLGDFTSLVEAFVASPAFMKKPFFLVHALETTTAKLPEITCFVCERYLETMGEAVKDIRQRSFADAKTLSDLVIRVYAQSTDANTQTRCLNIIDLMSELSVYSIQQDLSRFDR